MIGENVNSQGKPRGKKNKLHRGEIIFIVAMLAIPTIQWCIFWLYVNVNSFRLAFIDSITGAFSLANFRKLFADMTTSYGVSVLGPVINTFKHWAVLYLLNFPLSFIIAYFLYKKIFAYKVFRVVFFLPSILTSIVLVTTYQQFLMPGGPIDKILHWFGKGVPVGGYMDYASTATPVILIYTFWTGFGTNVILFGSAMARIPEEVIEAARLDGCKPSRELVSLILPLIWPTMSTMILLGLTSLFSTSGHIMLFDPFGDNRNNIFTLSYWIYKKVFGGSEFGSVGGDPAQFGYTSAVGLFFTVIWVPVILFLRWVMDRIPTVEY